MRRLKKIDVNFISLVDKGANRKKLIFKREGAGEFAFEKFLNIKKQDIEERMIFCIVYSPEEPDTQGDCASADVIKEAAYNFMRSARTNNVDKQHDFVPDEGFVAESWIVKENDFVFPEEAQGSWAVGIKVENDDTWELIKSGSITGISLAGLAVTEEITKQEEAPPGEEKSEPANIILHSIQLLSGKLDEALAGLNKKEECMEERLSILEKDMPFSRQVHREIQQRKESIKIWT